MSDATVWLFFAGLGIGILAGAYAVIKMDSQSGPKF